MHTIIIDNNSTSHVVVFAHNIIIIHPETYDSTQSRRRSPVGWLFDLCTELGKWSAVRADHLPWRDSWLPWFTSTYYTIEYSYRVALQDAWQYDYSNCALQSKNKYENNIKNGYWKTLVRIREREVVSFQIQRYTFMRLNSTLFTK